MRLMYLGLDRSFKIWFLFYFSFFPETFSGMFILGISSMGIFTQGRTLGGVWGKCDPPPMFCEIYTKKSVPKPEWDEKVGPAKI